MKMDQMESTSILVQSTLKKNTNSLDQVVHRFSPVIQLIKSWTEQSIFVEIGPYTVKFGRYFIDYLRQFIILLNVMVKHFDTGLDCGPDHFLWTGPHTGLPHIPKGLKMDWSGQLKLTNLQLDQTTEGTLLSWQAQKLGCNSGPLTRKTINISKIIYHSV